MKTIEQLTGTKDIKTNLICFVLLSFAIVVLFAFTVLAFSNGLKSF
jgi:hypothetical protein